MWTNIFGASAQHLCGAYRTIFGSLPRACLVSAGYPALIAASVLATIVVVLVAVIVRRRRRA